MSKPQRPAVAGAHAAYDCDAVSQVWAALGITTYTGKRVAEHVAEVVARLAAAEALAAEVVALNRSLWRDSPGIPYYDCCGDGPGHNANCTYRPLNDALLSYKATTAPAGDGGAQDG